MINTSIHSVGDRIQWANMPWLTDGMLQKFWSKFNKNAPAPAHRPELGSCWIWTGSRTSKGYGVLTVPGTCKGTTRSKTVTHRIAWQVVHGSIQDDLNILHKCDTPPCGNPEHLFAGTQQDNVDDCIGKGRARFAVGEAVGNAKLTSDNVRAIRVAFASGELARDLAIRFAVTVDTIADAVHRRTWKHLDTGDSCAPVAWRTGFPKLTQDTAFLIRARHADGCSIEVLATEWNVTQETIRNVVSGRTWKSTNVQPRLK